MSSTVLSVDGIRMDDQDWTEVTLRSPKKPRIYEPGHSAGVPIRYTAGVSDTRVINDTEIGKPKILSAKSRADMAAARMVKKLTQKQLDNLCSFPSNSTNAFEAGRICPSAAQLQNLNRILGIKLVRE